ncbi:nitroreductase family protein [bacterium]|nr:nitroreductase family protein [bacterium]
MQNELSVSQAIHARKSIRKYTGEPISNETIRQLVDLAGLAPSPWNIQPWRIIAVKTEDDKQKLMQAAYGQPQVGASAVTFVIYTDMTEAIDNVENTVHPGMKDREAEVAKQIRDHFANYSEADFHWWGRAQGYSFMSFLLLAAQSHGFATSAMLGFDPEQVKALYNLPAHAQIPAIVAVGVPAEEGFPHFRHNFDALAKIV